MIDIDKEVEADLRAKSNRWELEAWDKFCNWPEERAFRSYTREEICRLSGIDHRQFKYILRRYGDIFSRFQYDVRDWNPLLIYILKKMKAELLKDYRTAEELLKEKQTLQAARMRAALRGPYKMSVEHREKIRNAVLKRYERQRAARAAGLS